MAAPKIKGDAILYNQILANHYAVNWKKQVLIFGRIVNEYFRQFATVPGATTWDKTKYATYASPCTYHKLFRKRTNTIFYENLDTIPCFFADIDYHGPKTKPYHGELYIDLLENGLQPTLFLETPRGFQLFYYLRSPLIMRWENIDGTWKLREEAYKARKWWNDISIALSRKIISIGYPADTGAILSPARLMRKPTDENVRHYDENCLYTMDSLNDAVESWKNTKILSWPGMRKLLIDSWNGVEEGQRNNIGSRIAMGLAYENQQTPEAGQRVFFQWCGRCTPPYPENEARYVWASAMRKALRGEICLLPRESERTWAEQGPYAAKIYRTRTDEKIAAAVLELQAEGIQDPWKNLNLIARRAGISYKTIWKRSKDFESK